MKRCLYYILLIISSFSLYSCDFFGEKPEDQKTGDVSRSPAKDEEIQRFKIKRAKELSSNIGPCDTTSVMEYVLDNYAPGTYLVDFDRTLTFNTPKPSLYYHNENGNKYIFGIIIKSGKDHRLVEAKNVVGFDQSFIDLDSTELGTAYFYLVLFKCDTSLSIVWEALIPNHGGSNRFFMEKWNYNGTPYMKCNFHNARGVGHFDYNYFFIDGIESPPHLLLTYEGINYKRTLANVNNDKYPDYYEFLYYDSGTDIIVGDSVAFTWDTKDSLYVNTRNRRQTRPY